ncbi:hypothetical protein GCM10027091_21120 [Streptomyces daliensis]
MSPPEETPRRGTDPHHTGTPRSPARAKNHAAQAANNRSTRRAEATGQAPEHGAPPHDRAPVLRHKNQRGTLQCAPHRRTVPRNHPVKREPLVSFRTPRRGYAPREGNPVLGP